MSKFIVLAYQVSMDCDKMTRCLKRAVACFGEAPLGEGAARFLSV